VTTSSSGAPEQRSAFGALLGIVTGPPRLAAELAGAAATAGVEAMATGTRLLGAVEELVTELAAVTARLDALLGTAERLAARVEGVVGRAEAATHVVDEVIEAVSETVGRIQPVLARLEPALVDDAVAAVRQLPDVLGRLEEQVLPTVRSLGGLVPVVDRLNANVDGLHDIVSDVGALLSGIPGSARLLRRGERDARAAGGTGPEAGGAG
jgi:uncharacterized protein YoxC